MTGKAPSLNISILGTRGIPARYGGFETFAEALALRLYKRGHTVSVYGRRRFFDNSCGETLIDGVRAIRTPTIMHKYLETPLHALSSFVDLLRRKVSVVLLCNAANTPFAWLARVRRIPVVVNLDGIERHRRKWNWIGKLWYRFGEICACLFGSALVADARLIGSYYRRTYGVSTQLVAYGAEVSEVSDHETLSKFGLARGQYILYVSRLEPENNALGVIQAYVKLKTEMPLVVVGDAPYAKKYISLLRAAASNKVVFTGFQFSEAYRELRTNCYIYVQATEVGGTHPALVEAMAYGNCIIANSTPEHFEVLGGAGEYYWFNDFDDLARRMASLLEQPQRVRALGILAQRRARERYSWDLITDQYEQLFQRVVQNSRSIEESVTAMKNNTNIQDASGRF